MRRVLLILMIAVLPVRGWAADMMGVAMAAHALSATLQIAGHSSHANEVTFAPPNGAEAPFSMSSDCPMWAAQTAGDDPSSSHEGCATCQLCMALVAGYAFVLIRTASLPQAVQEFASIRFTSAEHASGFKPPIS